MPRILPAVAGWFSLCAATSGCLLPPPPEPTPEAPAIEWAAPEATEEAEARRPQTILQLPMTAAEATVRADITVQTRKGPTTLSITQKPSQTVLVVRDLLTMTYPVGHVLLDPAGWSVSGGEGDPAWMQPLLAGVLSDDDVPTQITFELQSVGELTQPLTEVGSQATALVVGSVQIGTRKQPVHTEASFTRTAEEELTIATVEPVMISLARAMRGDRLPAVAAALGVTAIEEAVGVHAEWVLQKHEGELPSFQRLAVTTSSVLDIKADLEKGIDRYALEVDRMRRMGVSKEYLKKYTREEYERIQEAKRKELARQARARGGQ